MLALWNLWWNEHVEKAIAAKRKAFKAWNTGKGTRASYDAAKSNPRHAVYQARQEANKKVYENIDPKSSEVYCLANQFKRENADVVGDKPVKNDAGEMSMSEGSKQKAWLEHYQRLLNVEFDWDPDHLSYRPPVEDPPIPITIDKKAISQMEAGKALGPSGIVVEMIRAAGDRGDLRPQLQSSTMARYPLTGSRVLLSASTRERGNYLLVHTISHSVYQSLIYIANKKTLSLCRSFFVILGVRKRPIAKSILAVSESVLKFRTVNFLANHNF